MIRVRIIESSSFQMKKKLFPTSCRLSSSKKKPQKLSFATFGDAYPTQKSFFADPVPPDFQIDSIKEEISDRLLDGSVKVRKKLILKSSVKIRDFRRTVLYSPESFTDGLDLSCGDTSQENIRKDSSNLILSFIPPLKDGKEESSSAPGNADAFYQTKSRFKVLEKITVSVVFSC